MAEGKSGKESRVAAHEVLGEWWGWVPGCTRRGGEGKRRDETGLVLEFDMC